MRTFLPVFLVACSEYDLKGEQAPEDPPFPPEVCFVDAPEPEVLDPRTCDSFGISSFEPVIEWEAGSNESSRATVAVGDLDGDGMPEIVANFTPGFGLFQKGHLVCLSGTGQERWRNEEADLGFASSPAIGDLDGDGVPEIVGVRAKGSQFALNQGDYTVVAWNAQGVELWESAPYSHLHFDYASGPALSDMDHDGRVEVVAGRVILDADGTERGVGEHGHGSYGVALNISEASLPAITDLNLDGVEEVVVGDAVYSPDGETLWHDPTQDDGMIGIANLDDDAYGEFVASSWNTVRAVDTDGSILWGPIELPGANILSPAAIADLDGDGYPEVVVAGGNQIRAIHHDGTTLWQKVVTDMSGASGASIFDFDNDGVPEVVYIDEIEIVAYDGATGAVKFHSTDHGSDTMMDYAVIADVDADGAAEIVVAHVLHGTAISVYGDANGSWAPARPVWNQHAYSVNNVLDDLSIPPLADLGFTRHNTWHAASNTLNPDADGDLELSADLVDVCDVTCDDGSAFVSARVRNHGTAELPAGVALTLFAITDEGSVHVGRLEVPSPTPPATTSEVVVFEIDAALARRANSLRLEVDEGDAFSECDETNNASTMAGPICP